MTVTWSLSDGTDTIVLSPGATFKRTLDKTDSGLIIRPVGRQSTPTAKSLVRSRDIIVVNTTFDDLDKVDDLFEMVKEETNASNGNFTFTKGSRSFNVAVRRIIEDEEAGGGELSGVEIEMEIVQ